MPRWLSELLAHQYYNFNVSLCPECIYEAWVQVDIVSVEKVKQQITIYMLRLKTTWAERTKFVTYWSFLEVVLKYIMCIQMKLENNTRQLNSSVHDIEWSTKPHKKQTNNGTVSLEWAFMLGHFCGSFACYPLAKKCSLQNFSCVCCVSRYFFKSGNIESNSDKFYNTTVEVLSNDVCDILLLHVV